MLWWFSFEIQDYDGGDFQFEVLGSVGKPQNFGRWVFLDPHCCEMAVLIRPPGMQNASIRNQHKWWEKFDLGCR